MRPDVQTQIQRCQRPSITGEIVHPPEIQIRVSVDAEKIRRFKAAIASVLEEIRALNDLGDDAISGGVTPVVAPK